MLSCDEEAVANRVQVINTNPIPADPTLTVVYTVLLERPCKEMIGKQVEFISQWIENETTYKKLSRISGCKGSK